MCDLYNQEILVSSSKKLLQFNGVGLKTNGDKMNLKMPKFEQSGDLQNTKNIKLLLQKIASKNLAI